MAKIHIVSKPATIQSRVHWAAYPPSGKRDAKTHLFLTKAEAVKFAKSQEPHYPIDIYGVGLPPEYWTVDWFSPETPLQEIKQDTTKIVDMRKGKQ